MIDHTIFMTDNTGRMVTKPHKLVSCPDHMCLSDVDQVELLGLLTRMWYETLEIANCYVALLLQQ